MTSKDQLEYLIYTSENEDTILKANMLKKLYKKPPTLEEFLDPKNEGFSTENTSLVLKFLEGRIQYELENNSVYLINSSNNKMIGV